MKYIRDHFETADYWSRVVYRLKKGYKITLCDRIRQRISWDWYKAVHMLKKNQKSIGDIAMTMVTDEELGNFLSNQKIKIK